jgi:hypothetical protein
MAVTGSELETGGQIFQFAAAQLENISFFLVRKKNFAFKNIFDLPSSSSEHNTLKLMV